MSNNLSDTSVSKDSPRLLDRVRGRIRVKHYSIRTETAYIGWIRRFILFHDKRHPTEMGKAEVEAFLTSLAVERNVSAATQNQALSALLFLYRDVLEKDLPWLDDVTRAKKPARLPTVLTTQETASLLDQLEHGEVKLVVRLLYGSGLRLLEALRLRVKDVDLSRRELLVRDGKGGKDRVTMLAAQLIDPLRLQMGARKSMHDDDLAKGRGEVWLPDALAVKYPAAARAFGWQYVFAAPGHSIDPRSGAVRRHHLDEKRIQRAVKAAAARAGIAKAVSPHTLRHGFATHLLPTSSGRGILKMEETRGDAYPGKFVLRESGRVDKRSASAALRRRGGCAALIHPTTTDLIRKGILKVEETPCAAYQLTCARRLSAFSSLMPPTGVSKRVFT